MWYGSLVVGLSLTLAGPVRAAPEKSKDKEGSGPVALLNKAIKAVGGEAKLKKLKMASLTAKGTMSEGGMEGTVTMEATVQDLDKYRLDASMSFMGMMESGLIVINGDKGWAKTRNMIQDAPEGEIKPIISIFQALRLAQMLVPLKDKDYKLSALAEVKVGGKPALGIKATRKGFADVDIYFDKKTYLPVKCKLMIPERRGQQEKPYEFLFSEPKKISGLNHFTKVTVHRDDKKIFELELSAVRPEDKLDKKLFVKPE
jgi:hypothetical protein